jgi:hypothetical protein
MSQAPHEPSSEGDDGTPAGPRSAMAHAIVKRGLPGRFVSNGAAQRSMAERLRETCGAG